MGRYTQQQLREVLRLDQSNEYVLICMPGANQSLILPEIRAAQNVSVATVDYPSLKRDKDPWLAENRLRHSAEFQDWFYQQKLDLYHVTVPMLFEFPIWTHFNVCPLVSNLYDLIPLIFPNQFLARQDIIQQYRVGLRCLRHSDHLIAISESARNDMVAYLGYPRRNITVAYPIADPHFRVQTPSESISALSGLKQRVNLPEKFALSVSYPHYTKNLETLLKAYGRVDPSVRKRMPLVLTFEMKGNEAAFLRDMAGQYGIENDTILTGYVSEDELAALYNTATLVIHPSRYEGFGLPVVEAMRCGAPVITTTSSSLPEVGGNAAILVDPDDDAAFAKAITLVATDPERRRYMREQGLLHAETFNAFQLGQATLDSYSHATAQLHETIDQPHIAIWTPIPPQRSGIADYSLELLDELVTVTDVEVFVDDGVWPEDSLLEHHTIQHFSAFERRQKQTPFDAIIYQVGASSYHTFMAEPIEKWPGIVVLHDLIWGWSRYHLLRNHDARKFERDFVRNEGREAFRQLQKIERSRDGEALNTFLVTHFMLKAFLDASLAAIVHLDAAKRDLNARYNTPVYSIPEGVADPWRDQPPYLRTLVREQLQIESDTFLIGIFGLGDPVKRIEKSLQALAQVVTDHSNVRLAIVGQIPEGAYSMLLDTTISSLNIQPHVRLTGFIPQHEFNRWLLACDVVINLRFPSRRQMSAILMRSIAAGKPVIISDIEDWRDLPDDFCLRVMPDEHEVEQLAGHLRTLIQDSGLVHTMGQSARRYYEENATLAHMARHYLDIIRQLANNRHGHATTNV